MEEKPIRQVTYETPMGRRSIPFRGPLTPVRREQIVAMALADGCADEATLREHLR